MPDNKMLLYLILFQILRNIYFIKSLRGVQLNFFITIIYSRIQITYFIFVIYNNFSMPVSSEKCLCNFILFAVRSQNKRFSCKRNTCIVMLKNFSYGIFQQFPYNLPRIGSYRHHARNLRHKP